jgi:Asp/Glu/hydantoin racemase
LRIWHQSFTVLEDVPAYTARVRAHVDRVKRPDTQVDLHGLKPQTYPADYPGDDLGFSFLFGMHASQWAANALTAAREGYDAFAMCTMIDPLFRELKTIVDIPVVAAGELCFHLAAMNGHRFGMLLFMDRVIPRYHEQVRLCGLTERCAAIRPTGMKFADVMAGFDRPGPAIDRFRAAARELIAAGADVIIPGEIPMNVLLATEGVTRVDDALVLDGLGATVKMSEAMVDMKASIGLGHSRHGFFNAAPRPERIAQVMDFYLRDTIKGGEK